MEKSTKCFNNNNKKSTKWRNPQNGEIHKIM